jgi:hypothetical protein
MMSSLPRTTSAGTERIDNRDRIQVDVIQKISEGKWSWRRATVNQFADARIIICEEFKNKVEALCLVIITDKEATVVPVRLLEEKV